MIYIRPIVLILGTTSKTESHLVKLLEPESDCLELLIAIRSPKQAEQF